MGGGGRMVTPPSPFPGLPVNSSLLLLPRFQNQQLLDQAAIQTPYTHTSFSTLGEAVGRLLPYHACAGPLPPQDHFHLGQQALWVSSRDS